MKKKDTLKAVLIIFHKEKDKARHYNCTYISDIYKSKT